MRQRVCIVSSQFPPITGGVADHTAILAATLSDHCDVSVLTTHGARMESPAQVLPVIENWCNGIDLVLALSEFSSRCVIIWQYVPHAYGRGGIAPALPKVLDTFRGRGGRQILIAHELYAALSPWPHRFCYAILQRRQWRALAASADAIGISTEVWLDRQQHELPGQSGKMALLPSGSTIPVASIDPDHRKRWRRDHGLPEDCSIILSFGAINASERFQWTAAAQRAAEKQSPQSVALVAVGSEPRPRPIDSPRSPYRSLGFRDPKSISLAIQAADLLALPFRDGTSERRTTFLAGLSHGCPIATTHGTSTGRSLRAAAGQRGAGAFISADALSPADFNQSVCHLLGNPAMRGRFAIEGKALYNQRFSWKCIGERVLSWIQHGACKPVTNERQSESAPGGV